MKKILLATNLITALALCSILFTACPAPPKPTRVDNTCNLCEGPGKGDILLPSNYVKALMSNYRDNHWNWVNSHLSGGQQDSRSVWFNMEELKAFIAQSEAYVDAKKTEKCGDHCAQKLGVRIYFGEYGGDARPDTPLYNNLHTLVMIPTYFDATLQHNKDFDPRYMSACGGPSWVDTAEIIALLPSSDINMMNHGSLIPPPNLNASTSCTGASLMHFVDKIDASSMPLVVPFVNTACP